MADRAHEISDGIRATQSAQMESCPPELHPLLAQVHKAFNAMTAVGMEYRNLKERADRLRITIQAEGDAPVSERARAEILRLEPLLAEAKHRSDAFGRAFTEAGESFEDARRVFRTGAAPEERRIEALALLDEERATLKSMGERHRAASRVDFELMLAGTPAWAHLALAREADDPDKVAKLEAIWKASIEAAGRLDDGNAAFKVECERYKAEVEERLKALIGSPNKLEAEPRANEH